ncbi:hypothetical protein Flav3CDRAFT_0112 [Flavobacteria bacterium MS024-3C]|nr:hypothetical protein Flav3CDRAFT_0112 [Flavobacteria bacterium MS024-3C]
MGYKLSRSFNGSAGIRYGTLLDRSGGLQGDFYFLQVFLETSNTRPHGAN